jgi:hypothetical protein
VKTAGLEKLKGRKISGKMHQGGAPDSFGKDAATAVSRREQRKLDQAEGLVPFAVKLNAELVKRIQGLAQERKTGVNEIVSELLQKGLDG